MDKIHFLYSLKEYKKIVADLEQQGLLMQVCCITVKIIKKNSLLMN